MLHIETSSKRLKLAGMLCRLIPIFATGVLGRTLYPQRIAADESPAFIARSTLTNITIRGSSLNHVSLSFALRGFFEWRNVVLANSLCVKGDTIVDIGANIGTETLIFARIVGHSGCVIAFEPFPDNFNILDDLIKLNNLNNILLFPLAVSDNRGKLAFLPPPNSWSIGEGRLLANECRSNSSIWVESVTLDEIFLENGFKAPRLIIMDVEGAELRVLRGAEGLIDQCRPYIVFEWNKNMIEKQNVPVKLFEFFEKYGYKIWEICACNLTPITIGPRRLTNCLAIPQGHSKQGIKLARSLSAKLFFAAFFPLIRGINPAVVVPKY